MKIRIAFDCQHCKKNEASLLAVATGAAKTPEMQWKLCSDCASLKTKYGNCWEVVGKLEPIIRDTEEKKHAKIR